MLTNITARCAANELIAEPTARHPAITALPMPSAVK